MATISVENAVVKGHHVYWSEVRTGDIFDCFPELDNLHDPDAQGDERGKCRWTSSDRLCSLRTHLQPIFGTEG